MLYVWHHVKYDKVIWFIHKKMRQFIYKKKLLLLFFWIELVHLFLSNNDEIKLYDRMYSVLNMGVYKSLCSM